MTSLHRLLLSSGERTLPAPPPTLSLALLPPQVHSHSREELWSLTLPTFLSIITLGASSIRPSGFKNSSANSIQIPGGFFFLFPREQREDYLHLLIIASDLASVKLDQTNPFYFTPITECCGLHLILSLKQQDQPFAIFQRRQRLRDPRTRTRLHQHHQFQAKQSSAWCCRRHVIEL